MTNNLHGDKLKRAIKNEKVPESDKIKLEEALTKYNKWIQNLKAVKAATVDELIDKLVKLLNKYKNFIDLNLIYDSKENFLYRQKGQLKIDNTVLEEFLPILVSKCVDLEFGKIDVEIGSQVPIFSTVFFKSNLGFPSIGGGLSIKTKNQDFSMSRTLYLKASSSNIFEPNDTVSISTHLGYVIAEIKTNLDKTMFQEAAATAHDLKLAVTGAKYYLLCDYLDMTPISASTTDIDEVLVLRKAKRLSSTIRKNFSTYEGRRNYRDRYKRYLNDYPYSPEVFKRFINHIFDQIRNKSLAEEKILNLGYF